MRTTYITFDDDGYVNALSGNPGISNEEIKMDLEDDHPIFEDDFRVYRLDDNQLIADEQKRDQIIAEFQEQESHPSDEEMNAIALMELTEMIMGGGD